MLCWKYKHLFLFFSVSSCSRDLVSFGDTISAKICPLLECLLLFKLLAFVLAKIWYKTEIFVYIFCHSVMAHEILPGGTKGPVYHEDVTKWKLLNKQSNDRLSLNDIHVTSPFWSLIANIIAEESSVDVLSYLILSYLVSSRLVSSHLILINSSPPSACRLYASVNRVSICSDNGLSLIQRQAIIYTNAGLLSIGPLGTDFSEIWIEIQNFLFAVLHLKTSSANWQPFCQVGRWVKRMGHVKHTKSRFVVQAIIWTNAGILLIRTSGTKFNEILSEIRTFLFKKMHLKMSSGKCRPFCLSLNVLRELNLET